MNEEQLKLLYDSYASKNGFSNYSEFKSLMDNDNSRKVFFESSKKELGFKDYNEFNSLVGLKKKDSSEKVWGSKSKPKDVYTTLVTEAPKKTGGLVSSNGISKKKFPFGYIDTNSIAPDFDKMKPVSSSVSNAKGVTSGVREVQLRNYLKSVSVNDSNSEEVSKMTDELSSIVRNRNDIYNEKVNSAFAALNQVDKTKVDSKIKEEENPGLFKSAINKVTDVLGKVTNNVFDEFMGNNPEYKFTENTTPFKDQIAKYKKLHPQATDSEAYIVGKQMRAHEIEREEIARNYAEKVPQLDDDVKASLRYKDISVVSDINDIQKGIALNVQSISNKVKLLSQDLKSQEAIFKSGQGNTQEFLDSYKSNIEEYNKLQLDYTNLLDDYEKNDSKKTSAKERIKMYSLNYGLIDSVVGNVTSASADIVGGAIRTLGDVEGTIGKKLKGQDNETLKGIGNVYSSFSNTTKQVGGAIQGFGEKIGEDTRHVSLSDIVDSDNPVEMFGRYAVQTIAGMAPYSFAEVKGFSMGAKAIIMAGGAGGVSKRIDESGKNYSELEKYSAMAGYAGAEYLALGGASRALQGLKPILGSMSAFEKETFDRGVKSFFETNINRLSRGVLESNKTGVVMASSAATKMFVDEVVLGQKVDDRTKKILVGYLDGAAMHSILATGGLAGGYALEKFSDKTDMNKFKSNIVEMTKLHKEITIGGLSDKDIKIAKDRIEVLNKRNQEFIDKKANDFGRLTRQQRFNILDIEDKKQSIRDKVKELKDSGIPEDAMSGIKNDLAKEWNSLEEKRKSIFEDKHNHLDTMTASDKDRLMSDAEVSLNKELNPTGKKQLKITEEQIKDKALEIQKYADYVDGLDIKDLESKKKDAMSELEKDVTDAQKESGFKITNYDVLKKVVENEKKDNAVKEDFSNVKDEGEVPTETKTEVVTEPVAKEPVENIKVKEESVDKENKSEETKKVSDDYVSLSDEIKAKESEIKSTEEKIAKSKSENRKSKMEEAKSELEKQKKELESKRDEAINSDEKMKFIHDNMDKLIKELEKADKLKKEPCNL